MMTSDESICVLQRRAYMLQGRIVKHETESGKPASYDRREMRALRKALLVLGVDHGDLPPVPPLKLGPSTSPVRKGTIFLDGVPVGRILGLTMIDQDIPELLGTQTLASRQVLRTAL